MPGMTAGPPGAGIPSGMYRRVVTRESFNLEKMVPLTAEEILESKQFQDLQQHMSDATKTDAEKELGRKQLAELLEKQFTRDFDTREKDVLELETRVQKLREQLNKRKAAKEKIIELRMTTIQNEIDGLGFPGGGGVVPGGGFTAPAYIPGSSFAPGMPNGLEPTLEPNSDAPAYNPPNPAPSVPRAHPFSVPADGVPVDATGFAPAPNVAPFAEPVPVNTNSPVELPSADKKAEEGGGANLLQNPSFEDGPNGWGTGTNPETVEYKIGDKGGTNLTRAAIIHKTADKYFPIAEWTQPIEYDGKSPVIQLMATVKTKDATKAILDVLFLDDKGEWIKHEWAAYIGDQSAEPKPLTHDWKVYKGAVSIPAGTKQIVIGLQDYGPGTVWFDDVSAVYLKELPQEPNHLPNNKQEPLSGL